MGRGRWGRDGGRSPRGGPDILGRQLMVKEGLSHKGNLLSSLAHSSMGLALEDAAQSANFPPPKSTLGSRM